MTIIFFCPIMTDDAGLFVDELNGEPSIYTFRYADDEIALNPKLPQYQCVIKLLRNLNNKENRKLKYKCYVSYMMSNGERYQELDNTYRYRHLENL